MGKWRELFEAGLSPVAGREDRTEYTFGPPATTEQIAAAEATLKVRFPPEVREMLSEFNGMSSVTTFDAGNIYAEMYFLDLPHMTADVPDYCADCGNPMPPEEDLRKVVWVAQSNGFGELWGVCAEAVAGHPAGAVVHMDHEVGELEACQPSLAAFVRRDPVAAPPQEPDSDAPPAGDELVWREPAWKGRVAARPPRCLAGFTATLIKRTTADIKLCLYLAPDQAVFTVSCQCGGRQFKLHGHTRPDPATGKPTFGGPLAAECVACGTSTPIPDPAADGAGEPTVETCCYCGVEPAEVFVGFEYPEAWTAAAESFRGDEADAFGLMELYGRCAACGMMVGMQSPPTTRQGRPNSDYGGMPRPSWQPVVKARRTRRYSRRRGRSASSWSLPP